MPSASTNKERFEVILLKAALAEIENTSMELFRLRNVLGLNDCESVMGKDLTQLEQRSHLKKNKYFHD